MNKTLLFLMLLLCFKTAPAQHIVTAAMDRIDGQGSFENVEPGDIVIIQGGIRGPLIIQNLHGSSEFPVMITVIDGQEVDLSGDLPYGISIRNCSYIKLSGGNAPGVLGIRIHDLNHANSVGLSIGDKSSDIEIDHIEISHTGFAGILAKTEPECTDISTHRGNFTQKNTHIHHCKITDTGGEGLYIGSTSYGGQHSADCGLLYPPVLEGVHVHHNLIERTGWDGIQVSSALTDVAIHDNQVIDCSVAQVPNQMSGILIGGGTQADCYNNWIEDCYGTGILVFGNGGTRVFNNVILRPALRYEPDNPDLREHGIFLNDKTHEVESFYGVFSNTIIHPKSDCIRVSGQVDQEVRIYNNFLINPGAYPVYENDNTDRVGHDAYVFLEDRSTTVRQTANANFLNISGAQFVDVEADNYQLNSNSQYIDAGRNLADQPGVSFDYLGYHRPYGEGYDVGAFEYGAGVGFDPLTASASVILTQSFKNSGNLNLQFMTVTGQSGTLYLINSMGQLIHKSSIDLIPGWPNTITIKQLSDGIYFLTLVTPHERLSQKLLVH